MSISHRLTTPIRRLAGLLPRRFHRRSSARTPAKRPKGPTSRRRGTAAPKRRSTDQNSNDSRQPKTATSRARAPELEAAQQTTHAPLPRWGETPPPPPVRWIVDNLILAGALNIIAGAPGVGKTSLTMYLAACVATGQPFLGRTTQQGGVLFVNYDDPNEAISRGFFQMACSALGRSPDALDVYHWSPETNLPASEEDATNLRRDLEAEPIIQWILAQIRIHRPVLVIIDSYSAAYPRADGNRGDHVVRADAVHRRLMREIDEPPAIVLIDHTPKPTANDGKNHYRGVSGSQQKHARARSVHLILPDEAVDDTVDLLRWRVYKANAAKAGYDIGIQRELDENRKTLRFTTIDLPDTAQPKRAEVLPVVLRVLREEGDPITKKNLIARVRSSVDVGERTIRAVLESDAFKAHGNVRKERLTGRGSPVAFRWIETDTE